MQGRSAARPAVRRGSPVLLLCGIARGFIVAGGAEKTTKWAWERGGAVALADAAAGRTPVLAILVAEGIAENFGGESVSDEQSCMEHFGRF